MYSQHGTALGNVSEVSQAQWISVINPTLNELHELSRQCGVPVEFMTAALDSEERPRFEVDDGLFMILLRIPMVDSSDNPDTPYYTIPISFIFVDQLLITVCDEENPLINDFAQGKVKNFKPDKSTRSALQFFHKAVLYYLKYLKHIEVKVLQIERNLLKAQKNKEILVLMAFEKSLIYFSTSIRSNQIVFDRLKRTAFFRTAVSEERDLLEEIIIDNTQAIEMARIYTNILSGLMDTFASVISNNLSNIMWALTKITIVLMLPTLITSIYGMNLTWLPFAEQREGLWYVLGICGLVSTIALVILNQRRWFN
jgi:magnesium transporter